MVSTCVLAVFPRPAAAIFPRLATITACGTTSARPAEQLRGNPRAASTSTSTHNTQPALA